MRGLPVDRPRGTLTPKGQVKILDFGLAKLASERKVAGRLTKVGTAMGTPDYMAPEQASDTAGADVRADIYALGGTLYCLLTGRPPFQGATLYELIAKHMAGTVQPPSEFRNDLPPGLEALAMRMLVKSPADRPQTPKDVADALLPFVRGAGTSQVAPAVTVRAQSAFRFADEAGIGTVIARHRGRAKQNQSLRIAVGTVATALFAAILFVLYHSGQVPLSDPPQERSICG